jgi:hypothetical protein
MCTTALRVTVVAHPQKIRFDNFRDSAVGLLGGSHQTRTESHVTVTMPGMPRTVTHEIQ